MNEQKKLPSAVLLFALVFIVAACAAGMSIALYTKFQKPTHQNAHDWIHTQLAIITEQDRELEHIERNYRVQRRELEQNLLLANRKLAEAILADGKDSQRVHGAIEKIHLHMGTIHDVPLSDRSESLPGSRKIQIVAQRPVNRLFHPSPRR